MRRRSLRARGTRLAPGLVLLLATACGGREPVPYVLEKALRGHVEALAAPALHGRGAWPDREKAAAYVAAAFEAAGLGPAPGLSGYLWDDGEVDGHPRVRNVVGWLAPSVPGAGPMSTYVLVSANYDQRGVVDGKTCPGADDNATGVAALIETARALTDGSGPPRRHGALFVAFDLREQHQAGSRSFAARPPLELEACITHVCLECLGRSFGGTVPGGLIAMGTEHSAELASLLAAHGSPSSGPLLPLSTMFHVEAADYNVSRDRHVPFVYLSCGPNADQDQPTDTPDRIQWANLEARTRWIQQLVGALVRLEARPTWRDPPPDDLTDFGSLDVILTGIERRIAEMGLSPLVAEQVEGVHEEVRALLASGDATPQQRRVLLMKIMLGIRMIPLLKDQAAKPEEPETPGGG